MKSTTKPQEKLYILWCNFLQCNCKYRFSPPAVLQFKYRSMTMVYQPTTDADEYYKVVQIWPGLIFM